MLYLILSLDIFLMSLFFFIISLHSYAEIPGLSHMAKKSSEPKLLIIFLLVEDDYENFEIEDYFCLCLSKPFLGYFLLGENRGFKLLIAPTSLVD